MTFTSPTSIRFGAANSRFRRFIGGSLAALFFVQNAIAYQPQLSVWADRAPRVAAPSPIRAILPDVRRPEARKTTGVAGLPADFLAHVQVRSVRPGTRPGTALILEDVHGNLEAQRHLSAALIALGAMPGDRPVTVALEGAAGRFVFDRFHRFSEKVSRDIADAFLASGDIGGPSHAGFVARAGDGRRGLHFKGAENPSLYRLNVAAYRASAIRRESTNGSLSAAIRSLSSRRGETFSRELLALDDAAAAYDRGDSSMGEFADDLASRGVRVPDAARRFLEAWRTERSIDFPRVDAERRVVLEKLIALLKPADIESLVRLSLGYRDGSVSFGRYYAELKEICRRAGVRLEKTPAFDRYLHYVLLSDGIDAGAVIAAVEQMRDEAYRRTASSAGEWTLIEALKRIRRAERLARFALTPSEWRAHEKAGASPDLISSFEDFYRAAESRNDALAASLRGEGLTVLVVGGFHTDGILERLEADGRDVVVCSPRLTNVDLNGATAYLSVFEREKMPLEKIFEGRRLFLSPPPAGAAEPLVSAPNPLSTMALMASAHAAAERSGGETTLSRVAGGSVLETEVSREKPTRRPFWKTVERRLIDGRWTEIRVRPVFIAAFLTLLFVPSTALGADGPGVFAAVSVASSGIAAGVLGLSALLSRLLARTPTGGGDDRVRRFVDLSREGRGVQPWLWGLRRESLPAGNLVALADLVRTKQTEGLSADSDLMRIANRAGVRGVHVTAASVAEDVRAGLYAAEIESLRAKGLTEPKAILHALLDAVAIVADWSILEGGASANEVRVSREIDASLAVQEGARDQVVVEAIRAGAASGGMAALAPAHLFGRNGVERRGAIDHMIYSTVLNGSVPVVTLDFGVHTHLLSVKAFLFGLMERVSELEDGSGASEVRRLSESMSAVSGVDIDRYAVSGFDALIELAAAILDGENNPVQADRYRALSGKAGIAMAKVSYTIHAHVFQGRPLPEREIEALFGPWVLPDIQDARGAVLQIESDSGVRPVQRFVVSAPFNARPGDAALQLAALSGGWVDGLPARPMIFTTDGIAEADQFLEAKGLPRQEFAESGVPNVVGDADTLAAAIVNDGDQTPAIEVLKRLDEMVKFLHERGALPAEIESTARDHSRRQVSINDVVEVVQAGTARRLADQWSAAEEEIRRALPATPDPLPVAPTPDAGRTLGNRLFLISTFVLPLAILGGVSVFVSPGFLAWTVAGLWALPSLVFLRQAYHLTIALLGLRRWTGVSLAVIEHARRDVPGYAGFTEEGTIYLNWAILGRMPVSQQISTVREEERHARYQRQNLYVLKDLFQPRSRIQLLWEEWYVNVVMPVTEAWGRLWGRQPLRIKGSLGVPIELVVKPSKLKKGRTSRDFFVDVTFGLIALGTRAWQMFRDALAERRVTMEARAWIEEGQTLLDVLDAAAPKGPIFSRPVERAYSAASPADPRGRALHFAGLAGYRRAASAVADDMASSLDRNVSESAEISVITYHVNQLGDPSLIAAELAELALVQERAARERALGRKVAVVAAIHGDIGDAADRVAAIMSIEESAVVEVSDALLDGDVYSYEKLLSEAGKTSETVRRLVEGNYDGASFLTYSKVPSQFRADGRLRAVWTLLSNLGSGWAPIPVGTMLRAAELALKSA